ncbi:DUF222 domain-containing protein [Cellulomonas sp.]|uniref:DUF222 domain-containing protein n=1 Tax=Cellulomonas sp. TaxID=40001 RepID=UPI00258EDBC9|nr:DUF222 domain-containing protein [Cellulomonas sp.]MCR6688998.1 DUF222 domain-containing protein [Cellulomonas sp.]
MGSEPASGAGVLVELEAVAARLAGLVSAVDGAAGWDGRVRARVLRVLDALPGVVEALRAPVLVAAQRAAAVAGGERGFVDVRARLTGASRWQAAGQVAAAGALAALPVVREAVAGGVVPVGHVQVLARAWQDAGAGLTAAWGTTAGQEKVVELARGVDAREFSRSLAALAAQDDPDGVEDRREAARRARFLTLSHAPDGTFLRGRLDPVAGQVLARALEATGHRPDADRTGDQARADALTALAQHTLTAGHRPSRAVGAAAAIPAPTAPAPDATDPDPIADPDLPDGTPSAPSAHITLLVPAETWHAVRTTQQARRTRARAQRRADARESRPAGADLTSSSAGARGTRAARAGAAGAPVIPSDCEAEPAAGDATLPGVPRDGGASEPTIATITPGVTPRQHGLRDAGGDGALPGGVRDHDDSAAVPSAVTDDGTTITATELAAALCDCAMTRTVMNAAGLPLDVGRTRRMFTPAQRTAVTARDRHCAWNGCSVPARHCQIHHIAWWHRHTGTTDLTNAVLLCTFHHHEVHRLDLDIERLPPATVPDPVAASPHLDLDADAPPGRGHVASDERRGPPGWAAPSRASLGNPTVPVRYLFRDRRGTPYNAPGDPPPD